MVASAIEKALANPKTERKIGRAVAKYLASAVAGILGGAGIASATHEPTAFAAAPIPVPIVTDSVDKASLDADLERLRQGELEMAKFEGEIRSDMAEIKTSLKDSEKRMDRIETKIDRLP